MLDAIDDNDANEELCDTNYIVADDFGLKNDDVLDGYDDIPNISGIC